VKLETLARVESLWCTLLGPVSVWVDRFSRDGRPAGELLSAGWWRETVGPSYDVLGPSVHHYLDHDRHLPPPQPVSQDRALLAGLRGAVDPGEWTEGGFGEDPETVFVATADGRPVAAAATARSLQVNGLARWRAREENAPSLALAARLGYQPWCRQLAVKPR